MQSDGHGSASAAVPPPAAGRSPGASTITTGGSAGLNELQGGGGASAGDSSRGARRAKLCHTVREIAVSMREEALSVAEERRQSFASRLDEVSEAVRRSGKELCTSSRGSRT